MIVEPVSPLLTDLYQLTMAQAYYIDGKSDMEACFSIYFRANPFEGGFAVCAGIELALDFLESFRFSDEDREYLAGLNAADGTPLFRADFLDYLQTLRFDCEVEAVAEGTIVFAGEPLLRVCGPIILAQLVETPLLNCINFSTLVATKAARCYLAAEGDPLLEFGLRRAQGLGGMMASRASYIGGCSATSNTLAGKHYGIPVAGTHAHSFVMAFDDEMQAFEAYVASSPNNVVLLVDTYDTITGVKRAIEVAHRVIADGYTFAGIRIDSGDLAWFSKQARRMLDDAGLQSARIYASNELDEYTIRSLKDQGAPIDVWGVGTKLATAFDQPALGGVYKLTAIRPDKQSDWIGRIKVSEQSAKSSVQGVHNVKRFYNEAGNPIGDMVYDVYRSPEGSCTMIDPADITRQKSFCDSQRFEILLHPVFAQGKRLAPSEPLSEVRKRALEGIAALDDTHQRFLRPHTYAVGLEQTLCYERIELIKRIRGIGDDL